LSRKKGGIEVQGFKVQCSGPPQLPFEKKEGCQTTWHPPTFQSREFLREVYWSGVPPLSGAAVPSEVKKIVPAVAVENPRVPVWPTDAGTAVA